MTTLLTRALQALQRALEDSQELINARVDQYGEGYRPEKLKQMRDDLAAGERVAEELRAAVAAAPTDPMPLPELPEPHALQHKDGASDFITNFTKKTALAHHHWHEPYNVQLFTADQMNAHARAAIAAAQEEADGWRRLYEAQKALPAIDAALASAAAPAQGVPAGWKLVPVDPTDDMKHAANACYRDNFSVTSADLYRAMLAATPPAQSAWMPIEGAHGARVLDVGFLWDGATQCHTPTLLVGFEPAPANGPCDAKGWRDRDAMAAAIQAPPGQQTGEVGRQPMTDDLHTFVNAAAGEGLVLGGIDAANLYIALFPERYKAAAEAAHHIGTAPTTGARGE